MNYKQFLEERFISLTNAEAKLKMSHEVWYLLHKTYEEIGGLMGANVHDLVHAKGIWKLVRKNGKLIAGIIYRDTEFGRKIRLVFHDATPEGKAWLKKILQEDISRNRSWGEISGALETVMVRMGAKLVRNDQVHTFLKVPKDNIKHLHPDGHHYDREVAPGVIKTQVLLGNLGA